MEYAIQTEGLTKSFGSFDANKDITVNIKKGSIYGLIGRNGAGKTTFMRMILGLIKPTQGHITLLGKSGASLNDARRQVGSIIETPAFYTDMTAHQNLIIRGKLIGLDNPSDAADEALKAVGLFTKKGQKVKNYSLGMRQSLGIAAAIMGNPEILILDEPVNGLDPIAIAHVREVLEKLAQGGTTILISSHILGEMQKLATCYGFIVDGQLVKELSEEDIQQNGIDLEKMFIKMAGGQDNE